MTWRNRILSWGMSYAVCIQISEILTTICFSFKIFMIFHFKKNKISKVIFQQLFCLFVFFVNEREMQETVCLYDTSSKQPTPPPTHKPITWIGPGKRRDRRPSPWLWYDGNRPFAKWVSIFSSYFENLMIAVLCEYVSLL